MIATDLIITHILMLCIYYTCLCEKVPWLSIFSYQEQEREVGAEIGCISNKTKQLFTRGHTFSTKAKLGILLMRSHVSLLYTRDYSLKNKKIMHRSLREAVGRRPVHFNCILMK